MIAVDKVLFLERIRGLEDYYDPSGEVVYAWAVERNIVNEVYGFMGNEGVRIEDVLDYLWSSEGRRVPQLVIERDVGGAASVA